MKSGNYQWHNRGSVYTTQRVYSKLGKISVRGRLSRGVVSITIQDTGIGIPRDALQKLGRPFEQVESQLTKSHQGSGLGLAIAKSLIELHGGAMRIRSEPGKGTLVVVRLPRVTPLAKREAEDATAPPRPRGRRSAKRAS